MIAFQALLAAVQLTVSTAGTTSASREEPAASAVTGSDRAAISGAVFSGGGAVAWGAVVIHHSGEAAGSAATIDAYQRKVLRDPDGIDHHFVIGNGNGSPDGAIAVTAPWLRGTVTTHLFRKGALPPSISVCLVGDLEKELPTPAQRVALGNLLAALCARHEIPVERVLTHREVEGRSTVCPGRGLSKLPVLQDAGLLASLEKARSISVDPAKVTLLQGGKPLLRIARAKTEAAGAVPAGRFSVCRRDQGGAFGPTLVIAYPGKEEIAAARAGGRISAEDAARLSAALAAGRCPPDDSSLGGEIGIHARVEGEDNRCVGLDPDDARALFDAVTTGAAVVIE